MKRGIRWALGAGLLASMPLVGCGKEAVPVTEEDHKPAKVEHLRGPEPARITLTSRAVMRLGIQTAPALDEVVEGTVRAVVPYSAVLYDTGGGTWLYRHPRLGEGVHHGAGP